MPELTVLCRPFEGFERALDRQIERFEAATAADVTVERVHRPLPEIHEELIVGGGLDRGEYDVFVCLSDWIASVVDRGLVRPLDGYLESAPPEDWPGGWADSMRDVVSYEGSVYGVPYHDGPEIFHYRSDLFESVEEQRRFRETHGRPLRVPRTWEEFLEVAEFFTRPDEGTGGESGADELWGTVVGALPDGHNDVYDFLVQLWSRGGRLFDADGAPAFDSPAGVEGLRFYRDLIHEYEVAPPECTEMESVESGEFYADGRAAMMWNWAGFGAMAEDPDAAVFGNAGYGLIPRAAGPTGRHTSLTVAYGSTIPASAEHPDLAYEFIRSTASAEMDKVTTTAGGSGTRLSTWRDPEVVRDQPFYTVIDEVNTGPVNTLPQLPEYTAFNEILNEAVERAVVERSATPEAALADAAAATRELLE